MIDPRFILLGAFIFIALICTIGALIQIKFLNDYYKEKEIWDNFKAGLELQNKLGKWDNFKGPYIPGNKKPPE